MSLIETCRCTQYIGTGNNPLEIEMGQELVSVSIRDEAGAFWTTKIGCTGKVISYAHNFGVDTVPTLLNDADIEMDGTKIVINTNNVALNDLGTTYTIEGAPKC